MQQHDRHRFSKAINRPAHFAKDRTIVMTRMRAKVAQYCKTHRALRNIAPLASDKMLTTASGLPRFGAPDRSTYQNIKRAFTST